MASKTDTHFDEDLKALNKIVNKMEEGNMPLETALKSFEDGVKLAKKCHNTLSKAEQKIEMIMEKHGELFASDFTPELDTDDNL